MNTAISENVIETMVKPISRAPFSAASNGRMPPSMWRTMFSSMTMASSTTKPTDSVSASNVMLLIENPNTYIAAQVPISDTGTANAGIMVAETVRRNRKITITTRQIAIASVSCTSTTDSRMEIERSFSTSIRIDGGTIARYCGNRARTRSTTATVLASGWRWIASTMARFVIEPACDLVVFDTVYDARNLVEGNRHAVAIGHDDLAVFFRLGDRARRCQGHTLLGTIERTHRGIGIGLGNDATNVLERNVA